MIWIKIRKNGSQNQAIQSFSLFLTNKIAVFFCLNMKSDLVNHSDKNLKQLFQVVFNVFV